MLRDDRVPGSKCHVLLLFWNLSTKSGPSRIVTPFRLCAFFIWLSMHVLRVFDRWFNFFLEALSLTSSYKSVYFKSFSILSNTVISFLF